MPRYQYKCTDPNCNKEITIECKMSQYSPTIKCECGEIAERLTEDLIPQNYIVKCDGFCGKKA